MNRRPPTVVAALLLAPALVLGACTGGSDDAGSTPSSRLPLTAWQRAEPDDVAAGGSLRVAVATMPQNFNPVHPDGRTPPTTRVLGPTSGGAIRITDDGRWDVDHTYARSVKIADTKPLTIEVALEPKAVWQDGTPITADDMVAFQKAMNGKIKGLEVASTDGYDDIASVEQGADRFTYTVTFSSPRSDWPRYVYPRLPADVSKSAKRFNGFAATPVPSNGPFMITSVEEKSGTITEKRNPRWWGRKPRLKQVVWRAAAPSLQARAFAAGDLDAVSVSESTYDIAAKAGTVQRATGTEWTHLTLNGGRGPLRDVEVRRAVAMALDRSAVAKASADAVGAVARTAGSLVLVPGQQGYRDVAGEQLKTDRAAARALLEKAGYPQQDGKATRDGEPLTLTLPVPADTPSTAARARRIVADLAAVGITVRTPSVPAATFFSDTVVPLDFDLATFTWSSSPFGLRDAESRFRPVDSPQNYTGVSDDALDDAWKTATQTLDAGDRARQIHALDAKLLDSAVIIPLGMVPNVVVVRPGLVNYGASAFEQPDFTTVGLSAKK